MHLCKQNLEFQNVKHLFIFELLQPSINIEQVSIQLHSEEKNNKRYNLIY